MYRIFYADAWSINILYYTIWTSTFISLNNSASLGTNALES